MRRAAWAVAMLAVMVTGGTWAAAPASAARIADAPGRQIVALDIGWKFARSDVYEAIRPEFDDAKWSDVTLPHTFNGADGDDGGGYYRGPGWYRRTFETVPLAAGRRVFLQFDAAALVADLWVNGRKIGEHRGGHAAFRFDITAALQPGRNMIAVRVDNTWRPDVTPLGGDFTVFGGLYRRVFLIETAAAHIDLMDHGSAGVILRTGAITADKAAVTAIARVSNDGAGARSGIVRTDIVDAAEHVVASASRAVRLAPAATATVTTPVTIPAPHRWNGRADPYLYHVVTTLIVDGAAADAVTVPLGLRTIAFDAARGFLLNGRPYPLHGTDLFNSERPGRGTAVTDDEARADVDALAEMGATSLRLVHFQHAQATYDEADRIGVPVWTEIGVNGRIDAGAAFTDNVREQLRELIRQNENHPSVILWGIGNEIYSGDPAVLTLLEAEQAVAHAEDPSRPTVYAHCCQPDDDPRTRIPDLIGFNRYFGWYDDGKGGTMAQWLARYHAAHPGKPFIVSEYGAGASVRDQQDPPGRYPPDGPFHPEQRQTLYHETNWRALRGAPGLAASYVWVGFDLASDGRDEGDRAGINDKGLISYDRLVRKDAYYWYKANWSDQPTLRIASRRFTERTTPTADVAVLANRGPVTLSVNGTRIGTIMPVDHVADWPGITLRAGENRIVASAPDGNRTVADAVTWVRTAAPSVLATGQAPPPGR